MIPVQQLTLNIRLRDEATFANYYNADNQATVAYLQHFLRSRSTERLVYLWGPTGVGRTHLLHACCHMAVAQQQTVAFLPLAETGLAPQLLEGLETLHWLCVDDLQAIAGNRAWEEALFHLYNRALEGDARWIIAANAPPRQLALSLPDLTSRLAAALVFRLQPLNDGQKAHALQQRAQLRGLPLTAEITRFLLTHYARDMSALFAALDQLDLASLTAQRKLTVPFVKSVLGI